MAAPTASTPSGAVLADADTWLAPGGAFVTLLARNQAATADLEVLAADRTTSWSPFASRQATAARSSFGG